MYSYDKGGLSWGEALTGCGLGLVMLGGMGADSYGTGYLVSMGTVAVGLTLAVVGQKVEKIAKRRKGW